MRYVRDPQYCVKSPRPMPVTVRSIDLLAQSTGVRPYTFRRLNALLRRTRLQRFRAAVAYARWDGIGLISHQLESFLDAGGEFPIHLRRRERHNHTGQPAVRPLSATALFGPHVRRRHRGRLRECHVPPEVLRVHLPRQHGRDRRLRESHRRRHEPQHRNGLRNRLPH